MSSAAFVDRVFSNLPPTNRGFQWKSWRFSGRPTNEGVGVLPGSVDVDKMTARIMDLPGYVGNVEFVNESRVIDDPAYTPPRSIRFYQRIKLPLIGALHHELVIEDLGERDGWRVLAWHKHPGTDALDKRRGVRSDYNVGMWLLRGDAVGYALSSSPRKDDVGRLKFAALTKGADAGAAQMLRSNIEGMIRWSER